MACTPYAPDFLVCSGLPVEPRRNPYGPGLPVPLDAPVQPLPRLLVPEVVWPGHLSTIEDELWAAPAPPVPEPPAGLLVGLVLALAVRHWRTR